MILSVLMFFIGIHFMIMLLAAGYRRLRPTGIVKQSKSILFEMIGKGNALW